MQTVSPICFDFNKLEVTIAKDERSITLMGSVDSGECKIITEKGLRKTIKSRLHQVARLFSLQTMAEKRRCTRKTTSAGNS